VSDHEPWKSGFLGKLFSRRQGGSEATTEPTDAGQPPREKLTGTDAERSAQPLAVVLDERPIPPPAFDAAETPPDSDGVATVGNDDAPLATEKRGWFQRLKSGLSKTSSKLSEGITGLFSKRRLDATTLDDLEDLLIHADLGVDTAMRITEALSKGRYEKGISPEEVRAVLAAEVERVLRPVAKPLVIDPKNRPHVILVVGVNGTGKTTTIGKLAQQFRTQGRRVTIAAGDTFRAAAIDQLKIWGERTHAKVVAHKVGADSSGLAFEALEGAKADGQDVLMIDTAGRLQNKKALMEELEKLIRVIRKIDPTAPHDVLLVLDATTGQNALSQVEVFRQKAGVTGLVMTKLDGTARGGILVAIAAAHELPVHAIGIGEGIDDLQPFDPGEFARAIAGS
jgi:fused signal recognition particle receptor